MNLQDDPRFNEANNLVNDIEKNNFCFLYWEPRVGKTMASLYASYVYLKKHNLRLEVAVVMPVGKGRIILAWEKEIENFKNMGFELDVQICYYTRLSHVNLNNIKLIILDESHNYISKYPKPSKTWEILNKKITNQKLIFLTATPNAGTYAKLYHQMRLVRPSPIKERNFYYWYQVYMRQPPEIVYYRDKSSPVYSAIDEDKFKKEYGKYFNIKTQKEVGIMSEANVKFLKVKLSKCMKHEIEMIRDFKNVTIDGEVVLAETSSQRMHLLHSIEGGYIMFKGKMLSACYFLHKIGGILDYRKTFPDKKIGIMYYYQHEKRILEHHFPDVEVYQCDSYAEGIDLSHLDTLFIYSFSFLVTKFVQRNNRLTHKNRTTRPEIYYLGLEGGFHERLFNLFKENIECSLEHLANEEGIFKDVRESV